MSLLETVCGNEARAFFFDKVGRYFIAPEDPKKLVSGTCAECGKHLEGVVPDSRGNPACSARRSISQKRRSVPEGMPVVFVPPSPAASRDDAAGNKQDVEDTADGEDGKVRKSLKGTKACINSVGCVTLIERDRSFVITSVTPTSELPAEMVAERTRAGVMEGFWKRIVTVPPKPPFLLVIWGQKADIVMRMTESLSEVFVCGEAEPLTVDLVEVGRLTRELESVSADEFFGLTCLRSRIARRSGTPKSLDGDRKRMEEHFAKRPQLRAIFRHLPEPEDIATKIICAALSA